MKKYLLMVSAILCFAFLTACSTTSEEKTVEKAAAAKKKAKEKKKKNQDAWYKEILKRDRVRDHDADHRMGDDFQVFPGRKGNRSSDLDGNFKAFFWE